jgi:hypothetical protein
MRLESLEGVDWASLTHAYGNAADLPDLLGRASSDDAREAERALYDLSGTIFHQGWTYSATTPAVPVLYELVAHPGTHHRPKILELLSDIAGSVWDLEDDDEDDYDDPDLATLRAWARDARAAVEAGVPTLISLLDDGDPAVRAAAPFVLSDFPDHDPDLVPVLQEKAVAEDDPGAAASMVLAVGDICGDRDDPPLDWLTGRAAVGRPREVRAAGVVALLWCGAEGLTDDQVQAVLDEAQAEESGLDGQLWVLEGGRTRFLTGALDADPTVQIKLARAALDTADPERRADSVRRAGEVMRAWRAGPEELLPPLAALLPDGGEVREAAVWEIKQGGPAVSLVADSLVDVLDDGEDVVAGSALEALGRVGDVRCLQALAADLAEPRLAFDPAPAIGGMKAHHQELLGPLREFLEEPKTGTGFAGNYLVSLLVGLRAWGESAQPLLPDLISVLERRKAVPALALTLGGLGAAAADAAPVLRTYLGRKHGRPARENAAWALWQITGEAEEPLRVLESTLRSGLDEDAAERLFDLGPLAEPALPLIESHLPDDPAAAAVIYGITGDAERALPHLVDAVAATRTGMLAVRALERIGPAAAAAVPALEEIVDSPRNLAEAPSTEVVATDLAYRDTAAAALAKIR